MKSWRKIGTSVTLLINKVITFCAGDFVLKAFNKLIITPSSKRYLSAGLVRQLYAEFRRTLTSNMKIRAYCCANVEFLWIEWRLAPFERPLGGRKK